jgi:hypothetical protein
VNSKAIIESIFSLKIIIKTVRMCSVREKNLRKTNKPFYYRNEGEY